MEKREPVTLESRLKEYASQSERAESFLRSYEEIREEMKMYLPAIFSYYPHYSAHDSSHSQSLISAMELILGEARIRELSCADIWLILVAAHLHDIGMIIPNEEMVELVNRPDFKKYLEGMRDFQDADFARAAALLLDKKVQESDNTWFLEIRQSVILLIAEYLRRRHAERSGHIISGDTVISRLLSIKHNGAMSRAYTTVGKICEMHGRNFDDIFTLYETDSILNIKCHPRFAAAMIRLGDLCDVDNGRFNAAMKAVFGRLPQSSLVHFYKHKTITRLCISTREICMSADIPFEKIQDELVREGYGRAVKGEDFCHRIVQEHQHWFDMIKEELKNLLLHAGEIFPENMDQTLPAFKQEILVNGQRSVFADSNLRLNFAPEKAYALIEGYSLYDEQRTFVRELIQNSLDAMKIQLWRDLKDDRWNSCLPKEKRDSLSALEPYDLCKEIYESYRVEIKTETDRETDRKTIIFRDSGVGISYDDLQNNIIRTGTSWGSREKYESELNEMPPWLRPTGGFGIGLHSVFAVTDKLEIMSKTRYEACPKHIIIHSGQQDGFVFARTVEKPFFYGTQITVEIDKPLSEIRSAESEITPYDTQSEDEFAFFIEEYLKKIICCPLFSVYLNDKEMGEMLCTGKLYGAIFDRERRDEKDGGVALAVTDDVPMRYIVWNSKAGHFYRMCTNRDYTIAIRYSFKGIHLQTDEEITITYDNLMGLESLEALSVDSKRAVSADRKDFLTEYRTRIQRMMKIIYKPLLRFGEEQFLRLLKAPSGSLSTEAFLMLCDEIARFSGEEDVVLSSERKERLNEFTAAMAGESEMKRAVYFIYLGFAHLRYFQERMNQLFKEYPDLLLEKENKEILYDKLIKFMQPQFQLLSNMFIYLHEQIGSKITGALDRDFWRSIGHVFGHMFGYIFGNIIKHQFNVTFLEELGKTYSETFGHLFGKEFDETFNKAFCNGLDNAYSGVFFKFAFVFIIGLMLEFGAAFICKFDRKDEFGSHILSQEWAWLAWIGYCEKSVPKCVNSVYFQSIPTSHFSFWVEEAETVFDILDKSELSVLYKNLYKFDVVVPFSGHLTVKEIKENNNRLLCSLAVEDGTKKTIDESGKGTLAAYYRILKEKKRSIFCPTSYGNIGIEVSLLHDLIPLDYSKETTFRNLYLFLPRTVGKVDFFDFITQNKQSPLETTVAQVMEAEDTVNIIKYTWLHRRNKNITLDAIRAEYRRFLMDFVSARLAEKFGSA